MGFGNASDSTNRTDARRTSRLANQARWVLRPVGRAVTGTILARFNVQWPLRDLFAAMGTDLGTEHREVMGNNATACNRLDG